MELVELGTILEMEKGKKPVNQIAEPKDGFLPYVDIDAFEKGIIKQYTDGTKCTPCDDGDILIVCDGSRSGLVGKAVKGYVGSTLARISAPGLNKDYLYYFVQGKYALLNTRKKGTGTPHLNPELLKKQKLVVPDSAEQERIVARIEELFSQLDAGVETLKKTKAQLTVYRQAVLKEAFDGSYIKNTSSEHKTMRVDEFAYVDTGATPLTTNKKYYGGTIAWVASGKINDGFIYSPTDYITDLAIRETNCKVFPVGTLLIAMYGEGKTRGKCAELRIAAATNQAIAAISLKEKSPVTKDFLRWYFIYNYQIIRRKAVGGVQPNLNLGIIKSIVVKVFSIEAQKETIAQIETRLSICDSIEQTVDTALQQAEAMRQNILKDAFEGRL